MGAWASSRAWRPCRHPGLALDLGPVQRPLGHEIPGRRGMAPCPICNLPCIATVLAAGVVGYVRLGCWITQRGRGWVLAILVAFAAAAGGLGLVSLHRRMSHIPRPTRAQEAEAVWYWIDQVGPRDGVIATYEVTAPLSSRKLLYSYIMEQNKPHGFPHLGSEFHWVFVLGQPISNPGSSRTRGSRSFTREIF